MGMGESRPHLEVFKRIVLVLCSGMMSGVGQENICVTWDLNLRLVKVQGKHPNSKICPPCIPIPDSLVYSLQIFISSLLNFVHFSVFALVHLIF